MKLDIHSAVQTAFFLALAGILITTWIGVLSIRAGKRLPFFRKRRDRMVHGWRMIFSGASLLVLAFFLNRFAEPLIYKVYPPTATITSTPTITLTPTITVTPTVTLTPTITPTTSITPTPFIPTQVATEFIAIVTPNPEAVFSPLQFAKEIDKNHLPVDPSNEFKNPVGHVYATFSYDKMLDGSQWTALWYRNGELVFYETKPWDGGSGGYGYTDWNPSPDQWYAGEYGVYLFSGTTYMTGSTFTVVGDPASGGPTRTPTRTTTPKISPTASLTPTLKFTPTPRPTSTATRTPPPTSTPYPSRTPKATDTHWPTATEIPTQKR